MLTMIPAGKRRWQRVVDSYEKGLREGEEEEIDEFITDRTRLLNVQSSSACILVDVDRAEKVEGHAYVGQAQEDTEPSEYAWTCEKNKRAARHPELANPIQSKHAHILNSACPALPIKKHCNHASWQGFKQVFKKQFTPPFPFGKSLMLPEDLQHLRQRRVEGAMHRSSKVLGTSTNLVELRKLDATIQNGINKSAFVASSKRGRSKENLPCGQNHNLGTAKTSIKLSAQDKFLKNASENVRAIELRLNKDESMEHKRCMKENSIFRKIKRQAKKENAILLANASK